MAEHLALYRKYRPITFDELIGQDHIAKILKNQIKSNELSHAYLFAGSRGTGKTSTARIFAHAINCLNPVDSSPCGECAVCKGLKDANNLDIVEIDAASNNKVDEIRELREKVKYAPIVAKYKVYIIDEVHMLTDQAFNALLKTLEEPPANVIFILATTEVHKLPSTILSRCLKLDFRLVETNKLKDLLKKIFDDIGVEYEDEALTYIARAGAGSVRDTLSIADMCVAYSGDKIKYKDVLNIMGANSSEIVVELANYILNMDAGSYLKRINEIAESGKNLSALARDLAVWFKNIIIVSNCKDADKLINVTQDELEKLKEQQNLAEFSDFAQCLNEFNGVEANIKFATSQQLVLEVAGVNCINYLVKKNEN